MTTLNAIASYFVGDWLVDPKSNTVVRGDDSKHIEPKAMRVLTLLASNAGQVVTREELEDVVWADMIVGPDALTNTVIKLRRALGDDAKNSRYIETIPKTGYRLIATVREAEKGEIEQPLERRLSAVLYADVAGYSRLTGEDEERTHRILSVNLDLFAETIVAHHGTVVHYAGDAILAEFATVSEALKSAVEVQRALQDVNASSPDTPSVEFRIGINLGEVIVDRDDIYGDGVNIAARLESLADAGGICISESVYAAVGSKLPVDYQFMGEQSVKNITEPVRAYRVLFHPAAQKSVRKPKFSKKLMLSAATLATLIIGSVVLWPQFSINVHDEGQTATTSLDKPTIAVLPFANVSVDVNEEYLADGMTTDLITDLSKISGIYVIARSSVFAYKNQAINVSEISQQLGAQYIVEGSVRKSGNKIRINVQLIDATTSRHLWADRYERDFDEFFALQDDVITQVVSAVSVTLTDKESAQVERPPTTNLQAYDYYLRAEQAGYIGGKSNLAETLELYQKAISLDPEFADAYAGLARAAVEVWRNDVGEFVPGAPARQLAYDSASRALEIDPANGQGYSVLAVLQLADGHHETAITSARKAVELTPGRATAHLDLGLVLAYSGDSKLGLDAIETALRLNPKSTSDTEMYAGIAFFIDGQYQRAETALSTGERERKSPEPVWTFLAAARAFLGRKQEAAKTVADLLGAYPNVSIEYYRARYNYFRHSADLERLLAGLSEAGLPQWAFGFQGAESDRLNEQELSKLVEDSIWFGRHVNGIEFFQQFDSSGDMAYRSKSSIQSGTASIRQGMLCQRFEGSTLSKDLCGYVYRNGDGSNETQDEYIAVLPDSLRYFTVNQ
jgi:adenylate cyclase